MPRHSAKVFCWQLHTLYTEGGGRRNKISAVLFKTYCILQVCPTEWTSLAPPIANNSAKLLLFTLQCYINYQLEYANIHSGPSPTHRYHHCCTTFTRAPPKIGTTSLRLAHVKSLRTRVTLSVSPGKVHSPRVTPMLVPGKCTTPILMSFIYPVNS